MEVPQGNKGKYLWAITAHEIPWMFSDKKKWEKGMDL